MSIEGEARSLMNNEAFVKCLSIARDQAIVAAMQCEPKDDEGRRRYLDVAKVVNGIPAYLSALLVAEKMDTVVSVEDHYELKAKTFLEKLKGIAA